MEKIKRYYNSAYSKEQLTADLGRKDRLKFFFADEIMDKKILDVGCGPAVDIRFLCKTNEVHGIDILEKALQIGENFGVIPHKSNLDQIEQLPFKDKYFDIILATDILEHLFFPKDILLEIRRVMKDDGFAILSVPNHFYWRGRLKILCGKGIIHPFHKSDEWNYFHIRFFTVHGWEKLLQEVGFIIVNKYYDKFIEAPRRIPSCIAKRLAKKNPSLFSLHFMCKVKK